MDRHGHDLHRSLQVRASTQMLQVFLFSTNQMLQVSSDSIQFSLLLLFLFDLLLYHHVTSESGVFYVSLLYRPLLCAYAHIRVFIRNFKFDNQSLLETLGRLCRAFLDGPVDVYKFVTINIRCARYSICLMEQWFDL